MFSSLLQRTVAVLITPEEFDSLGYQIRFLEASIVFVFNKGGDEAYRIAFLLWRLENQKA